MQQPMQVNILWLQDTLATLSPSLHLATSIIVSQQAHTRNTLTGKGMHCLSDKCSTVLKSYGNEVHVRTSTLP